MQTTIYSNSVMSQIFEGTMSYRYSLLVSEMQELNSFILFSVS